MKAVKHLKQLGSNNSDDNIQSKLPVESVTTGDVENTKYSADIWDDESEGERREIMKSASQFILEGA
jgi:hypothetical protein